MYRDTITLFNRRKGSSCDVWYPSVLRGVHLNMDKASIIAKYGSESADNAVLNVRYRVDDAGRKVIGDKIWLPPKEWAGQSEELVPSILTFASGTRFDFFLFDEWDSKEQILDDAYTDGFYNHMNANYDYVFAITAVGGPYSVIPHFEIMGK